MNPYDCVRCHNEGYPHDPSCVFHPDFASRTECPTECDDDCYADCHEGHQVTVKRLHQPDECPSAGF